MAIHPALLGVVAKGGGVVSQLGYYGPEYSGLNNNSPINIDSSSYDEWTGSGSTTHNALDFFIDHNASKFWGGYNTASSYSWSNGGNNYTGNANFYSVGTQTNLSGHAGSGLGGGGRGITVGYLNDASRTAVICIGHTTDGSIWFFKVSDGSYLGKALVNASMTSGQPDLVGLAWDGFRLMVTNRQEAKVFVFELPSTTSISGSLTLNTTFTSPHAAYYAMAWTGDSIILSNYGAGFTASEFVQNGTSYTLVGSASKFSLGTTSYSIAIDYRNRKLVMGGYSNNKHRVWGE